MNIRRTVLALTTLILIISMRTFSANQQSSAANASPQSFLGRWDLSLKTPVREAPSWLEITKEDRQFKARMVSRLGPRASASENRNCK